MYGIHHGWRRYHWASQPGGQPAHTQSVTITQVATAVAHGGGTATASNTLTVIVMCG